MKALRLACVVALLAAPSAGCRTRLVPYEPGPVRITHVDYREAPGPPRAGGDWKLLLSKERLLADDAMTVTVLLDPAALGKTSVLRVAVAPSAAGPGELPAAPPGVKRAADEITLGDVRNTQIDIHVYFIGAPPGPYAVSAELTPPSDAPARRLAAAVTVSETP